MRFGNIDDDNTTMHVNLSRRKANAGCGIHCFGHIAHQRTNFIRYLGYLIGYGMQTLIRILQYF